MELLDRRIKGLYSIAVATIGLVQLILAGPACQGFTLLEGNKKGLTAMRDAPMIALTVAFTDLYRPEYAILESKYSTHRGHPM